MRQSWISEHWIFDNKELLTCNISAELLKYSLFFINFILFKSKIRFQDCLKIIGNAGNN